MYYNYKVEEKKKEWRKKIFSWK